MFHFDDFLVDTSLSDVFMFPKVILILLILFLRKWSRSLSVVERDRFENRCCIVVWIIIVLMVAFRGIEVGTDTISYYSDYLKLPDLSFSELVLTYDTYIGYYSLSKLFSMLGLPVWIWFGFVEALYACAMSLFINKYSHDRLLGILLFVTIGLFSFSLSGLKQTMAMSLILFAYICFTDKRYGLSIVLVFLAYKCHPSCLVFLAAFPFYLLRSSRYLISWMAVSTIVVMAYGLLFVTQLLLSIENEHFQTYLEHDPSYSNVTLVFYIIIVVFSLINFHAYEKVDPGNARLCLGFSFFVVGLQALSSFSPNMFRLAYYYSPFLIILLPNSLESKKNMTSAIIRLLSVAFVVFYYLYTTRNMQFTFIWQ